MLETLSSHWESFLQKQRTTSWSCWHTTCRWIFINVFSPNVFIPFSFSSLLVFFFIFISVSLPPHSAGHQLTDYWLLFQTPNTSLSVEIWKEPHKWESLHPCRIQKHMLLTLTKGCADSSHVQSFIVDPVHSTHAINTFSSILHWKFSGLYSYFHGKSIWPLNKRHFLLIYFCPTSHRYNSNNVLGCIF